MDISILLSTFRRPSLLEQTLRGFSSLRTDGLDWEVLLVDNYGDSKTAAIAKRFSGEIPLRYLIEAKKGKNNALNRALQEARGELFVFTDDDVLPDRDWLMEVWEGAKRWPLYHVFGGRSLPRLPEGKEMPFDHPFFENAFTIANWEIPEGCYNADKVWGPNMAIRATVFKDGWRFNPHIGPDGTDCYMMGSETELTTRLEKAGYRAVYLPRSVVFHQVRDEQMDMKWLSGRSFRTGREEAHIQGLPQGLVVFGIPVNLVLRVCKTFVMTLMSPLIRDERLKFERRLLYWHARGMLYQHWIQRSVYHS